MVRAMTLSLSAALAVMMFVVGTSAAMADRGGGHSGRGYISGSRQVGQSTSRMGRRAMRGGRNMDRRDRGGGRQRGWFSRGSRYREGAFIGFGGGSSRRGYRSRGFFFGYSFSWSEYHRGSGLGSGRRYRRDYRSEVPRVNNSSDRRAAIEHAPTQSGRMYVPLVASPSAPEILPAKD